MRRACALAVVLLATGSARSAAQSEGRLCAGDSVRVDGTLVGSVLAIDGPRLIVVSRGKPRCRAGEGHGDAPICDPAPLLRREVNLGDDVLIERRAPKGNVNLRTLLGAVIGTAAFGTVGYFLGPAVGFGSVPGCPTDTGVPSTNCSGPLYAREELESLQRSQDQRRGAFFFGLIGGTATAIFTRKLSVGWIRFEPTIPADSDDPWGLALSVPGVR